MGEIPEIKESFLFKVSVSGMGISQGLASMFVLFHDKLSFSKDWLSRIDLTLAFCVVLFSVRSIIELNKLMGTLNKFSEEHLLDYVQEKQPGTYPLTTAKKAILLIFFIIVLCFAVWLLTITSPPLISAAVFSFVLIATVAEILLAGIIKSIRK
ncbi:hypothetical protein GL58_01415 [Comamonas testosteroni]|uniref:Uncharacterized protein n=1 Tax=Comamonas testosteroni TaxID=285 RepID=A0A0L7MST7_COMTE|nr:hypothetical protein [Comamonas testosteroni]KOC24986.1 hypothetical protein GL58_01415 [Comamonas testosteroni]